MVETLLLAGIVAAPLGSAGLFVPIRRRTRAAGIWPATRRTVLALAGTCLLAAAVVIALRLLGVAQDSLVAAAAAKAAGDSAATRTLLHRAAAEQHSYPTYYGAAWDVLGSVLLSTSDGCR